MLGFQICNHFLCIIYCYASEVWGYLPGNKIQTVLNRWCKRILGVKVFTRNAAVAGDLGQYPLIIFHKTLMLKYWVKVVSGPRDMLPYIMYTFLKELIMSKLAVKTGQQKFVTF